MSLTLRLWARHNGLASQKEKIVFCFEIFLCPVQYLVFNCAQPWISEVCFRKHFCWWITKKHSSKSENILSCKGGQQGSSESKSWPCTRKPHESPHVPESTVHTKGWLIPPSPEAWYCSNSNNLSMKRMSPQWSSLGIWINLIVAQEIKKTCMNDVCFF